ncbi:methyltransferase domain-containing protein [Flavilitoribacter nigricans]|uniref:Methyltransferase type 11 domain-containing protein n=1 Tax=Flavilitoribacter nigricans (strain ATCC 23147 / DSM 23189 / NBRC 102662 / NCIMB 1420 / SS-2) TaxID=1122177 RepID=A0A2D0NC62_FLAN2|nr:class I SAM-dependent methyltransferase [Flavilitoribacter nigricans]PHN05960.1 hypothetical protein CRP01_13375 [Flavilitoribacter nigricans DSM 23189 = NBRC 102662]
MDSCCNQAYQQTFDDASAAKEMKDYLAGGVKKSSRPFLAVLQQLPLRGRTQLDIGAGIGAMILESFNRGLATATYVDIAAGYRQTFLQEATNRELTGQIDAKLGDFTELHATVDPADLVTLDKVICCYEDYEGLVRHSLSKARRWYVYSIPREVWWVRLVHVVVEKIRKIRGGQFRSFIHPAGKIEAMVEAAGFKMIAMQRRREWEVKAFERVSEVEVLR